MYQMNVCSAFLIQRNKRVKRRIKITLERALRQIHCEFCKLSFVVDSTTFEVMFKRKTVGKSFEAFHSSFDICTPLRHLIFVLSKYMLILSKMLLYRWKIVSFYEIYVWTGSFTSLSHQLFFSPNPFGIFCSNWSHNVGCLCFSIIFDLIITCMSEILWILGFRN